MKPKKILNYVVAKTNRRDDIWPLYDVVDSTLSHPS